jgi:transposase, IS30 family
MASNHHSHFSLEERSVLAAYLSDSLSLRAIAKKLSRSPGTLSEEIRKNSPDGTRASYDPHSAHLAASFRKWEANSRNPFKSDRVRFFVVEKLQKEQWSPETISNRMKEEYPRDEDMRISHETIYQIIHSREGKELGLVHHLRRGKFRKHRKRYAPKGRQQNCFRDVKSIHDRPKIIGSRKRYGDWETDTMEGSRESSAAVSVQKERRSRIVRLSKVKNKSAPETRRAIVRTLQSFPKTLRRSLTFDRGTEGAEHDKAAKVLELETYFCDPYSAWQKGGVENVIGLIRQYLPKGTDLSFITSNQLKIIENKLNNRPRKCLGWKTPNEVFSAHLHTLGVRFRG